LKRGIDFLVAVNLGDAPPIEYIEKNIKIEAKYRDEKTKD